MSDRGRGVVAFCCESAFCSLDGMETLIPVEVKMVMLPCSGRVDVVHILRAFSQGAGAVMVVGCLEGNCQYQFGNIQARKRVEQSRSILENLGMEKERVEMFNVAPNQGIRLVEAAKEMKARTERLGAVPWREGQQ